jgi:hypothetical protein
LVGLPASSSSLWAHFALFVWFMDLFVYPSSLSNLWPAALISDWTTSGLRENSFARLFA